MKLKKPGWHLIVLCISALLFFAAGARRAFRASNDFVPAYTGARCLLHGCNPYETSQLEQQFYQGGGRAGELPSWQIDVPVYPPSTFLVLSPLALLQFPSARLLWFLLNGCLFVLAAKLILSLCPSFHSWLAITLVAYILVSSGILLVLGQPATFAISLAVIATYLFLRGRLLPLGAILFMLSVVVKPQIGGLIVLYFLVQRILWRYAAASLVGALALLLTASAILGQHPRSAGWRATLGENLSATLSPGGSADPRPANRQAVGDVNLQALTSIVFADARGFNTAAYTIFLALLVAGIWVVRRLSAGAPRHLLAIGALSVLSLLPVYHRFYDTRLLLISVPAIVYVYQKRRVWGLLLGIFTVLSTFSTQYRVQGFLLEQGGWQRVLENKLLFVLFMRQQNLELLILFFLYLAAFVSLRSHEASAIASAPARGPAVLLSK